jgi:superfamily II DNA or RNA helicase
MSQNRIRFELAERLQSAIAGHEPLPKRPRPYQVETMSAMERWLREKPEQNRAHIHHATGLGKTVLYAMIARQAVGLRMLFIMPTKTLVAQTARMLAPYAGGMVGHLTTLSDITVSKKDRTTVAVYGYKHHSIVLTTDAGFRLRRNELLEAYRPHLILRDECHWAYTESAAFSLGMFADSLVLGVTATADYLGTVSKPGFRETRLPSGQLLYADPERCASTHFGPCLDERDAAWGIENKFLCPFEWRTLDVSLDLARVPIRNSPLGYDYDLSGVNRVMSKSWNTVISAVLDCYDKSSLGLSNRRAISICTTVQQANQLAEALSEGGVVARCVSAGTHDDERDEIFEAFEAGQIKHICSVQVLREGWDSPNADTAFMLRPCRSYVVYVQGIGRILRLPPDRPDKVAQVFDLSQGDRPGAPLSAPVLLGSGPASRVIPVEHWASPEGRFTAEGVEYVSHTALVSLYGYAWVNLNVVRRKALRTKRGRMPHEGMQTFYAVEDVREVLRQPLH